MKTISVSETHYELFDGLDTGYYPIAATEIKTKLSSRQKIQQHAGNPTADFHNEDEVGNRCADINDYAISWAYNQLSAKQKANYDSFGVKLVTGDDMGPYNEGPLWIWTMMDYKMDKAKTTMTVKSAMMRTPTDYFIGAAAGFHYCKVLSPFHALEWMLVDGLLDHNGLNSKQALFL
jgi:hypothetical protein